MIVNIVIVGLIFGYSGWMIYRTLQKGKQGACAGCDKSRSCPAAASDSPLSCCSGSSSPGHTGAAGRP